MTAAAELAALLAAMSTFNQLCRALEAGDETRVRRSVPSLFLTASVCVAPLTSSLLRSLWFAYRYVSVGKVSRLVFAWKESENKRLNKNFQGPGFFSFFLVFSLCEQAHTCIFHATSAAHGRIHAHVRTAPAYSMLRNA